MAHPNETIRQLHTPVSPTRDEQFDTPRTHSSIRPVSRGSLQRTPPPPPQHDQLNGKVIPVLEQPEARLQGAPASPVSISPPRQGIQEPETASIRGFAEDNNGSRRSSRNVPTPDSMQRMQPASESIGSLPIRSRPSSGQIRMVGGENGGHHSRNSSSGGGVRLGTPRIEEFGPDLKSMVEEEREQNPGLQYHAFDDVPPKKRVPNRESRMTVQSAGSGSSGGGSGGMRDSQFLAPHSVAGLQRPPSMYALASEMRGRTLSPMSANGSSDPGSPRSYARDISSSRRSPNSRPMSYIDLLNNVPYNEQVAPAPQKSNANLQSVVGNAASLLDTKKTLEMYRANVKKTNDAAVQYEFAIFMVNAAKDITTNDDSGLNPTEMLREAKHILQRLSDRAYPFAQYYLADGYFSGLFNKDKPDYDKAFPLFVAASKHGHAEAGYRAALCYEFGWGTTKSYPKAVQFYRNSASKNHPGAATRLGLACLRGDMGLARRTTEREGLKWLKRAQESADFQYNAAPYELGVLHLTGHGDDVFKDESYAAQLLTQAAELGHPEANYLMGQAYETGLYSCPRDAALSVHFYNGAATRNHPDAMMALCAWYMLGAPPVLEKDEAEAYAWAMQAAELGLPKAEYAVGYFTEMGIGCRRDPLQANLYYVTAAEKGNDTAKQRLAIIREAAGGGAVGLPMSKVEARSEELGGKGSGGKKKFMGIF